MPGPAAIPLRVVLGLSAALVALLAAGLLAFGLGGGTPVAVGATGGCTQRLFSYDAAEQRRQQVFERSGAALPPLGFYTRALDPVASLHAASHGYIVVYFRPGTATAALHAFAATALAQKVPVLVSPRAQRSAVVAISQDRELVCGAPDGAAVRTFAAGFYPSLAG